MKQFSVFFFIALCFKWHVYGISSSLPDHLRQCYKTNFTNTVLKPPLSIQLLVELIRNLEWEEKDTLNMRVFTTSLLHGIRLDGVQRTLRASETPYVVPYRALGRQFYKYKLLVDYLTSGKPQLLPRDSVNTKELCLLHEIISNTVHVWERGNEGRTCPELKSMAYQSGEQPKPYLTTTINYSRCPIESGVVKTKWGTISPGHLIAGIASALQETKVNLQKLIEVIQEERNETNYNRHVYSNMQNVSNVWVATLVGDLAEVTVQQAFNKPRIGNLGTWNSTYLPRIHYLNDEPFDMTSAELLGGIDGLILADKIKEWLSILSLTRFSQLLDMYYSNRGVAYDRSYRACERGSKLAKLLENNNLGEQTGNVAKLLQELGANNQYIYESAIDSYALKVVEEFKKEAEIATTKYNACEQDIEKVQPLEVIAILDETWRGYNAETLIGLLVETLDVNFYGSTLGIINGQTGAWITNVTYSLVQLYGDLYETNNWPSSLRLSKALETVNAYLQNQTLRNCNSNKRIPRSTVVLVMANTATLSAEDKLTSESGIKSIKLLYPETRMVYVTSEHTFNIYNELKNLYANDIIVKASKYDKAVIPQAVQELAKIPSRIMDFYCDPTQLRVEDYVTPGINRFYEIHADYVQRTDFSVQFKGNHYGEASICAYDSKKPEDKECRGLSGNDEVRFNARKFCPQEHSCNVHFSVNVVKEAFKCTEFDCRYPDQMRLDISTSWTRKSGSSAIRCNIYMLVVLVLLGLKTLNINTLF